MSLATRCPACGTVFRVVQDQLRVSEGWVRCGQCQEVFNALESLFELAAEAPLPAPSPPGIRPAAAANPPRAPAPPEPPAAAPSIPATDLDLGDPGESGVLHPDEAVPPSAAAPMRTGSGMGGEPHDPANPGPEPSPPSPFGPAISVSSLLTRSDPAPAPALPATPAIPATAEEEVVAPWPDAPVQPDLLDGIAPSAGPARLGPVGSEGEEPGDLPPGNDDAAADDAAWSRHDEAIPLSPVSRFDADSELATSAGDGIEDSRLEPQREWQRKRPRRPRSPVAPGPDATDTHLGGESRSRQEPAFLQQAARDARWQRPGVRAGLVASAVVLTLLMAAQAMLHFRDSLAAQWPALQSPLVQVCAALGCSVDAPRALDRISLDGSKLTSVEAGAPPAADPGLGKVLRFAAELHNAARHNVRAPALELSFTDALGQVVARRVLQPAELGLRGGAIAASSTWQIDTRLAVGTLPVAGFSAEIFYP